MIIKDALPGLLRKNLKTLNSVIFQSPETCLGRCEGTLLEVNRLNTRVDRSVMKNFIEDYERFKFNVPTNLRKGKNICI